MASVGNTTVLIAGLTTLTLEGTLATEVSVASELLVGITASNPRELEGNPRLIDTAFLLVVR